MERAVRSTALVWTLLKAAALAFVVIWLRVTYPRLREDQLQRLAWQVLIPLALLQLAVTGVVKVMLVSTQRSEVETAADWAWSRAWPSPSGR